MSHHIVCTSCIHDPVFSSSPVPEVGQDASWSSSIEPGGYKENNKKIRFFSRQRDSQTKQPISDDGPPTVRSLAAEYRAVCAGEPRFGILGRLLAR